LFAVGVIGKRKIISNCVVTSIFFEQREKLFRHFGVYVDYSMGLYDIKVSFRRSSKMKM
jgi:hypothetical protein